MSIRILCIAALVVSAGCAHARTQSTNKADSRALHLLVAKYAKSAEKRDVGAMGSVLHARYRLTAEMGGKLVVLDKKAYLGMLRARKLGGEKRAMHIADIDVTGNVGHVKVRFAGKKMRFVEYMALLRQAGSWRILSATAQIGK